MRMASRLVASVTVSVLLVGIAMAAQAPAVPSLSASASRVPELSEANRLRIQNVALQMENAQLRARTAAQEYEMLRSTLAALVQALSVEGYVLDLATLTYVAEQQEQQQASPQE